MLKQLSKFLAVFAAPLAATILAIVFLRPSPVYAKVTYEYAEKNNNIVIIQELSGESCVNTCGKTTFSYVEGTKYKFEGFSILGSNILVDGNTPSLGEFENQDTTFTISRTGIFNDFFPSADEDDPANDTKNPTCFIGIDSDINGSLDDFNPAPCANFPNADQLENGKCYLLDPRPNADPKVREVECDDPLATGVNEPDPQDEECHGDGAGGFIFCLIIEAGSGIVNRAEEYVVSYLKSPALTQTGSPANKSLFEGWKNMRTLANALMVPVFFLIIFSQALSLNIDAYTVKKMLPRLIAAVILIQFSYYFVAILVDITNVLGNGAGDLLASRFAGDTINPGSFASFLGIFTGLTAITAFANIGAVVSLLATLMIPLLISVIGVIFTLVFRQLMIVLLAISAPLAFAAWVLPNTATLFKTWWSTLLKTLMMYPMITLLFASGTILAKLMTQDVSGGGGGVGSGAIKDVMALIAIILPLGAVPFTFKFAGGAIGMVAEQANKYGRLVTRDKQGKRRDWYQKQLNQKKDKMYGSMEGGGVFKNPLGSAGDLISSPNTPGWVKKWVPGAEFLQGFRSRGTGAYAREVAARAKDEEGQWKPETQAIIQTYGPKYGTAKGRKMYDEEIAHLKSLGDEDSLTIARELETARPNLKDEKFVAAMGRLGIAGGQKDMKMPESHARQFAEEFGLDMETETDEQGNEKVTGLADGAGAIMHSLNSMYKGDKSTLGAVLTNQTAYAGKDTHPEWFFARRAADGKLHAPSDKETQRMFKSIYQYKRGTMEKIINPKKVQAAIVQDVKDNFTHAATDTAEDIAHSEAVGDQKIAALQSIRNDDSASSGLRAVAQEALQEVGDWGVNEQRIFETHPALTTQPGGRVSTTRREALREQPPTPVVIIDDQRGGQGGNEDRPGGGPAPTPTTPGAGGPLRYIPREYAPNDPQSRVEPRAQYPPPAPPQASETTPATNVRPSPPGARPDTSGVTQETPEPTPYKLPNGTRLTVAQARYIRFNDQDAIILDNDDQNVPEI